MTSLHTTFDRAPRFILLLAIIFAELMLGPLLARSEAGLHLTQLVAVGMMATAVWAVGGQWLAVALFVPTLAAQALAVYWGGDALRGAALSLRVLFFGHATGLIMSRTLREPEVSLDTLAGAACAYTLLAVIWANGYMLLELIHPHSFQIPDVWRFDGDPSAALAYFSFVTLTTVGYGDIAPLWPGAGGLAVSEAIVGQLYLAITIARLVGLHAARRG